jgi:hypothetical protein
MLASAEFRSAAHHVLFAERVLPLLHEAETVIDTAEAVARGASPAMSMADRAALGEQYTIAKTVAPELRELLYPED